MHVDDTRLTVSVRLLLVLPDWQKESLNTTVTLAPNTVAGVADRKMLSDGRPLGRRGGRFIGPTPQLSLVRRSGNFRKVSTPGRAQVASIRPAMTGRNYHSPHSAGQRSHFFDCKRTSAAAPPHQRVQRNEADGQCAWALPGRRRCGRRTDPAHHCKIARVQRED